MTEDLAGNTGMDRGTAPASAIRSPTAIGIGGGIAAGIASSFIPMGAIEGFVSAYGIAELLPAAAPPLGNTARLALSTGIGTLTAGALLALLPRGETNDMGFETTVTRTDAGPAMIGDTVPSGEHADSSSGFGASKLGGWLRTLRFGKASPAPGEIVDFADLSRTRMRAADQHPDAPVRAPILASSELGEPVDAPIHGPRSAHPPLDMIQPFERSPTATQQATFTLEDDMAVPSPNAETESAATSVHVPQPIDRKTVTGDGPEPAPASRPFTMPAPESAAAAATQTVVAPPIPLEPMRQKNLDDLSIAALLERLESGLQRRMAPVATSTTGAAETSAPDGRLVHLLQVDQPTLPSTAAGPSSDIGQDPELTTQRLRFRIARPTEAGADTRSPDRFGPMNSRDAWNDELEYQNPAVGGDSSAAPLDADRPLPYLIEPADATDPTTPGTSAASNLADDDMDAALRDALATLRQLSDRQRNV